MNSSNQLILDIGNTRVKTGYFQNEELTDVSIYDSPEQIPAQNVDLVFYSNVSNVDIESIKKKFNNSHIQEFTRKTKLPIHLDYETPETLGLDRIAGVVGANAEFPNRNVLVIDMGTCITLDLIDSSGCFQGGVISPGYKMRARAMHSFTGKLPLLEKEELYTDSGSIGKSTRSCMQKGAFDGVRYELQGFIKEFSSIFDELTIIMTGGDHSFFESKIKAPIFVRPNLILKGLHTIFEHNER